MVPAIASLFGAGASGWRHRAYGTRAPTMANWMPEVRPAPGEVKIESQAQDRFYKTDLDAMLKAKGITTLICAAGR